MKHMDKGVKDIKIVPCFLFYGVHVREGISREINNLLKDYPHISVTLDRPFGYDTWLAEILLDRVMEMLNV